MPVRGITAGLTIPSIRSIIVTDRELLERIDDRLGQLLATLAQMATAQRLNKPLLTTEDAAVLAYLQAQWRIDD